VQSMGQEAAKALYNWQEKGHPNYPDGIQDDTHLSFTGAARFARLAMALLAESENR